MRHSEVSKIHPGGLQDGKSFQHMSRQFRTNDEIEGCSALKVFLSKFNPASEAVFRYPKRKWKPIDEILHENCLWSSALCWKMWLKLLICQKSTQTTLWELYQLSYGRFGLTNRHIIQISGHFNKQSLHRYHRKSSKSQLKRSTDVLSEALGNKAGELMHIILYIGGVLLLFFKPFNKIALPCLQQPVSVRSNSSMQTENLPNVRSLFSGSSIGNVHVNFNRLQ